MWALFALIVAASTGPTATLDFTSATPRCSEEALRSSVATRLGYDPFVAEAPLGVSVRVTRAAVLTAVLSVSRVARPAMERSLVGPEDCKSLTETLALALAVAIDPLVLSRAAAPAQREEPEAPVPEVPRAPPEPSAVTALPAAVDAPPGLQVSAQALAQLELGQQPGNFFGLAAGIRVGGRSIFFMLDALALPPSSTAAAPGSVELFSVGGELGVCGRLWLVSGCGIVRALAMRFEGRGLTDARTGWLPAVSAGLRVSIEWPRATLLALTANAEARGALARPRLLVGGEPAWEQPFLLGSLGLGVLARIP